MMNVRGGCGQLLFMLIFLIGDPRYLLIISYISASKANSGVLEVREVEII